MTRLDIQREISQLEAAQRVQPTELRASSLAALKFDLAQLL